MVHSAVKHVFQMIGAVALLILIAVGFLLWRLDQGALSLTRFIPYVTDALNDPQSPYRLHMDGLFLAWEGGDKALELRATGVHLQEPSGTVIAILPEAALQVAPRALLRGQIRLRGVEIMHPFLHLQREADGQVNLGMASQVPPNAAQQPISPQEGTASEVLTVLVDALSERREGALAELNVVRVVRAVALVTDKRLGLDWTVPEASLELYRRGDNTVGLTAALEVSIPLREDPSAPEGGSSSPSVTTHMDVTGNYQPKGGLLSLDFGFAGVQPSRLASMDQNLAPLAGLDMPLKGKIQVELSLQKAIVLHGVGVQVTGNEGTLVLPDIGGHYQIRDLSLSARAVARSGQSLLTAVDGDGLDEASLDHLTLTLIPEHKASPAKVSVTGHLVRHAKDVQGQTGEEGGPALQGSLMAQTENVPVDALQEWWPEAIAPNPREWVVGHLRNGKATTSRWAVEFRGEQLASLEPTHLDGVLDAQGVTIDYLPPMPPVVQGAAEVRFTLDKLEISVRSGQVEQAGLSPLILGGGTVIMTGLDMPDQMTDISLEVGGDLPAALQLLDSKPLGYSSKLGLNPKLASGKVKTHLKMVFPPLADLPLEQIDVKADAELKDVSLKGAVFGQSLTDGALSLAVNTTELNAKGQAVVGGVPAAFEWREVFSGNPYGSRYKVKAQLSEEQRHAFGLDPVPFSPTTLGGPVNADVDIKMMKGSRTEISARLDLTPSRIYIPGFQWRKAPGIAAQGTAELMMVKGVVREVSHFSLTSEGDVAAEGSATMKADGGLDKVILDQAQVGLSSFAGTLTQQEHGLLIEAQGPSFDLMPFLGKTRAVLPGKATDQASQEQTVQSGDGEKSSLPAMTLRGHFDKVWLSEEGAVENVTGHARRVNDRWVWANVSATLGQGKGVTYSLGLAGSDDHPPKERLFHMSADDAGALLKALGWIGSIEGGELVADGTVDRQGTATGVLTIGPYRLVEAPLLARILSVAALTGILDSLSGEGIGFDSLYAPFVLSDRALSVNDFRTHGSALGLTAKGHINLDEMAFDLAGTIVPAYAVNGLLGKIPLVGGLLSGFTEGGGLIAATYSLTGPTRDPKISVNPLSALAPGFLKTLFGMGQPDQDVPPAANDTPVVPQHNSVSEGAPEILQAQPEPPAESRQ